MCREVRWSEVKYFILNKIIWLQFEAMKICRWLALIDTAVILFQRANMSGIASWTNAPNHIDITNDYNKRKFISWISRQNKMKLKEIQFSSFYYPQNYYKCHWRNWLCQLISLSVRIKRIKNVTDIYLFYYLPVIYCVSFLSNHFIFSFISCHFRDSLLKQYILISRWKYLKLPYFVCLLKYS